MTETTLAADPPAALHEGDFFAWTQEQAELLRSGRFLGLDAANLADEVEDMGNRHKRAIESNLRILLIHLLKHARQPERRKGGWLASIREHRLRLRDAFEDSPSLRRHARERLPAIYADARALAADETALPIDGFPVGCPFSYDEILDTAFLPED